MVHVRSWDVEVVCGVSGGGVGSRDTVILQGKGAGVRVGNTEVVQGGGAVGAR